MFIFDEHFVMRQVDLNNRSYIILWHANLKCSVNSVGFRYRIDVALLVGKVPRNPWIWYSFLSKHSCWLYIVHESGYFLAGQMGRWSLDDPFWSGSFAVSVAATSTTVAASRINDMKRSLVKYNILFCSKSARTRVDVCFDKQNKIPERSYCNVICFK